MFKVLNIKENAVALPLPPLSPPFLYSDFGIQKNAKSRSCHITAWNNRWERIYDPSVSKIFLLQVARFCFVNALAFESIVSAGVLGCWSNASYFFFQYSITPSPGLGGAFHPGCKVGGIPDRGIIHPEIIADGTHDDWPVVDPHAHPEPHPIVLFYLVPIPSHSLLYGQRCLASPLSVVLMGNRRTEERHNPVTRELIDGPLIQVDLLP